jgi:uncharacterized protein (DUF362 family)
VIEGKEVYSNTLRLIEELGGMQKIVSAGDSIGILINADFENQGAFVNPEIPLAVIEACKKAGVGKITLLQVVPEDYWKRTPLSAEKEILLADVDILKINTFPAQYNENDFVILPEITGGEHLKNVEIIKMALDCDVFINIPIAKHHATTFYTGALKNMMGLTTRKTNVGFHLDSGVRNDPEYLGKCIAELNLVRKPDLILLDGTEFIITNGPNGPGEIKTKNLIAISRDPVAIDALGAVWLDYDPAQIISISRANELGIGRIDLSNLSISYLKS